MPIVSRFSDNYVISPLAPSANLLRMFSEIVPIGSVLARKQFYRDYLPKYEAKKVVFNNRTFSLRPAWTDYKPDPTTHIIIIGHILLCHVFIGHTFYRQPSTRLFTEDTNQQLRQFKSLLDRVNSNKYPTPHIVKSKITA